MPRPAIRSRSIAWARRLLVLILLLAAWKAFWRFGPALAGSPGGTAPALFPLHARLLVDAGLRYPKPLHAVVPLPAAGSNAQIQLKLMGLLDGAGWTMKALQAGRVEGKDLKVRAGALVLLSVTGVGPVRNADGVESCRVDCRVRWELPEGDREVWEVKHLVDLRPPKGLDVSSPGQEARRQATLVRRGWRWECAEEAPANRLEPRWDAWRRQWPAWIF